VLEASVLAAQKLFAPGPLLAMLVMLPIALFSGATPGGNLPIVAIVLGFAGYFDPWITVTAVIFYLAANDITEPVPSILLGIPGSRSAQATVLDGYPMAQKGLAGIALGASYMCTLVGGIIGALALLIALPVSRELLRLFGSAEFFLLSLLGLVAVAVVSAGAFVKGMLTAAFGLAIAMIGFSPVGGVSRANFGIEYLWDGFHLAPIVVGLFAIPEAIDLVVGDRPIARERIDVMIKEASRDIYQGMLTAFNHKWLLVRSSLIGTFVGIMPGMGGSAAHWIAYVQARHTEKGGTETFGKGDVRGIISSDAAVNAVDGAELIPTVVFGIPSGGGMAVLLAILILSGVQPGPAMLTTHLDLTLSLVYTVVIANVVTIPIMVFAGPYILRVAIIPPNILAPIVIGFVTLAAYQATSSMGDLLSVLAFGTLGVFMKRYGWPRPPILMAVVLSATVEKYLWISMNTYGLQMLVRPQVLSIMALMAVVIIASMRLQAKARRAEAAIAGAAKDA
jgi:TctA family transporter